MDKKFAENRNENLREQLISLIIQNLSCLGERELDLVARFIKAISE